MVDIEEDIT